jgi:ABC-type multidrug transport system fused ATPase/permease subunit
MQDVIDTEFTSSQTVIAILHRLRHIDRFDRVVLLKSGQIVECDSSRSLACAKLGIPKIIHVVGKQ